MKIKRPSGLTLLAGALLILMPVLAMLQFRWVGQVSEAEKESLQRRVETAARQFQRAFDNEVFLAWILLSVGPETSREGAWHRFATRHDEWESQASRPEIVKNIYLVDADPKGQLRLRLWDNDGDSFNDSAWPTVLQPWQQDFQAELEDFNAARLPERQSRFAGGDSLLINAQNAIPVRAAGSSASGQQGFFTSVVFGFTVVELNVPYIQEKFLPDLAERDFTHQSSDSYRIAVVGGDDTRKVIYSSDPTAAIDVKRADADVGFFGRFRRFEPFGQPRETRNPGRGQTAADPSLRRGDDFPGRWRLLVQHRSGSLDAAVTVARRRNMALSFGVLILLTASIGLLTITSRKAQRLAEQQMEFVAGVSHELRTPVAVIKSAAENLSQGVVGNTERVKRYGLMIEGEARRLAEMVERVLQYAGIESGLGLGAKVSLSPAEIIQSAVDSTLPLLGPESVDIHRSIPDTLPPVMGDEAALRSAVQNLVANAVRYGGPDRWVGIRAEHVREHRRSEVRITISDHGAGIPARELPHIFEPFYRGGDALARQIHGNGLGLSLVKRIVAAHGGRVTVDTRTGAGSAFSISLPAAERNASATSVAGQTSAAAHL